MKDKILALCSGGLDSIVMLHELRDLNPEADIHTLFFDYGQKNVEQERRCAKQASEKLDCLFNEVTLPTFSWTSSEFYSPEFSDEGEYLEMRNLVFISYALSYCESQGCKSLYMALLKSLGYYDTSDTFLSKIRSIAADKGVVIETPFSSMEKQELSLLAFRHSIRSDDFFSCDNPIGDHPCGKCPDCQVIMEILDHATLNSPAKVWAKTRDPYNLDFQRLMRENPITEMRVLNNNDCQLKCKHCYYGFTDMKQDRLTRSEYMDVFRQAKELGINDFHFSGKEPLFDASIFDVVSALREVHPDSDCTVVTNGINIPKFARELKNHRFSKVFLSVDDVGDCSGVRSVKGVTDRALCALREVGIPVQVFIDLHENNYDKVDSIIDFLYSQYGVREFYARTISIIGSAKSMNKLTPNEIDRSYTLLRTYANAHKNIGVRLCISAPYVYDILDSESDFKVGEAISLVTTLACQGLSDNFDLFPEMYCGKYEGQITLTPDGFIHGCASEVSCEDYDLISPGNIRDESLRSLVDKGKSLCIKSNCNEVDENGNLKFFSCTCCNPID